MRNYLLSLFLLVFLAGSATAVEIAGVQVPDTLENGLALNGVGLRKKFFFKIYIAELYLEQPANTAQGVLDAPGRKRMVMHMLYDKITQEQLVESWTHGFKANLSGAEYEGLMPRIEAFNQLFVSVERGDQIILDYVPETGTSVTIAGKQKGVIEGADFNRGLLSIWLGKEPVGEELRDALLGKE